MHFADFVSTCVNKGMQAIYEKWVSLQQMQLWCWTNECWAAPADV